MFGSCSLGAPRNRSGSPIGDQAVALRPDTVRSRIRQSDEPTDSSEHHSRRFLLVLAEEGRRDDPLLGSISSREDRPAPSYVRSGAHPCDFELYQDIFPGGRHCLSEVNWRLQLADRRAKRTDGSHLLTYIAPERVALSAPRGEFETSPRLEWFHQRDRPRGNTRVDGRSLGSLHANL